MSPTETVNVTLRLREHLHAQAATRADQLDRSLNWLINEALSQYLVGTESAGKILARKEAASTGDDIPLGWFYVEMTTRFSLPNIGPAVADIADEVAFSLVDAVQRCVPETEVEVTGPYEALRSLPYDDVATCRCTCSKRPCFHDQKPRTVVCRSCNHPLDHPTGCCPNDDTED